MFARINLQNLPKQNRTKLKLNRFVSNTKNWYIHHTSQDENILALTLACVRDVQLLAEKVPAGVCSCCAWTAECNFPLIFPLIVIGSAQHGAQ